MYRLLVVDDEPEIAASIYELLQTEYTEHELELYKCYSGKEALNLLSCIRMDVVITDINMPGFSGFNLVEEINRSWKFCHVIFLTGFGSLEYLRTAVNYNNVQYLLKNEPDSALISAVSNAITSMAQNLEESVLEDNLKGILADNLPVMRREFIQSIIKQPMDDMQIKAKGNRLGVKLDPGRQVFMFLAVANKGFESGAVYCLKSLVLGLFPEKMEIHLEQISHQSCVCILQGHGECSPSLIHDNAAEVQTQLKSVFNISASFIFCPFPFNLSDIHRIYGEMLGFYFSCNTGLEGEFICFEEVGGSSHTASSPIALALNELEMHLEKLDSAGVYKVLDRAHAYLQSSEDIIERAGVMSEISLYYLKFVSRYHLNSSAPDPSAFHYLCKPYDDPIQQLLFLRDFTDLIFKQRRQTDDVLSRDVYDKLVKYISMNLEKDLTLTALSARIHFNPSYISRQFKALYGLNLVDYITMLRLEHSKKLLLETDMKIQDIALSAGYDTTTYFNRVFKKHVGTTPMFFRAN